MKVFIQDGVPEKAAMKLIRTTFRDYLEDPLRHRVFSSVYDVSNVGKCSVVVDFGHDLAWVLLGYDINADAFPVAVEDGQHRATDSHDALSKALSRRCKEVKGYSVNVS